MRRIVAFTLLLPAVFAASPAEAGKKTWSDISDVGVYSLMAVSIDVPVVKGDKHFWYDAAVGAGIGPASGFLITNKRPESNMALVPWADSKGGGLSFAMRF